MTEEEKRAAELELANALIDHEPLLEELVRYVCTEEAAAAAKAIEKKTGQNITAYLEILKEHGAEVLLVNATLVQQGLSHFTELELRIMHDVFDAIEQAKPFLPDAEKAIADAEKQLADGRKTLNQKRGELKAVKKKLKSEKKSAEKKIKDGWSKYYSMKASYESKLEEAKALLAENREEAERKLLDEAGLGKWLEGGRRRDRLRLDRA